MINMKYIYRGCLCAVLLFCASSVHAGSLSFVPSSTSVAIGEQFYVDVFLSPENVSYNGIEGSISYSKETLSFIQAEEGRSIVNAWIEKPHVSTEGVVSFAGIIPNGFMGVIDPFSTGKSSPGRVLRLVFEGRSHGASELLFISTTATENNGVGTPHTLSTSPQKIIVKNIQGKTKYVPEGGESIPEIEAYVTTDKDVYKGKFVLIYNASDSGSGIREVLIKEGDREWKKVEQSPYVLEDQSRHKRIIIQAVNFSDKKAFAMIEPLPSPLFSVYNILILFFGLVVVLIAIKYARRKKLF